MALFDGATRVPDSRSHSRLVVSEGFSPAERWITDPDLTPLFEYHYGGPGFVVIPKGTIVSVGSHVYDYEVGRYVNVLTIADGSSKLPMGVAPYNIYQRVEGRMYHNFPSMITRDYIEVPYMADADAVYSDAVNATTPPSVLTSNSLKMRWGCAYGTLAAGDFLTCDAHGKFVKLDSAGANFDKVVGQILAVETDMPPTGWLKWLDWAEEHGERADDQNRLPYPSNPDTGRPWTPDYKWPLTQDARGIPGMTDGGQIGTTDVALETVGQNTVTHALAAGTTAGATVVFRLAKTPVIEDSVTMQIYDGTAATPGWVNATGTIKADETTGWVYYTATAGDETLVGGATPAAANVRFTYQYHDLSKVGVPAAWDFKGSLGAVRILLKF